MQTNFLQLEKLNNDYCIEKFNMEKIIQQIKEKNEHLKIKIESISDNYQINISKLKENNKNSEYRIIKLLEENSINNETNLKTQNN